MKHLLWIAVLAGSVTVGSISGARAQMASGSGAYPAGPGGAPEYKAAPADPGNCGTPDQPKPCPPMPRRALKTYPGPHHASDQG